MRVRGYASATPCWAELASDDPATSIGFYRNLFGWRATTTEAGSTVFTLRDLAVAGLVPAAAAEQPSTWFTYVATEDISVTAASVVDGGGRVLRPPTEVGHQGRAALFADREGAVFAGWQRGTFAGAQVTNEPSAVCWSEVATRDTTAASAFYHRAFGWTAQAAEVAGNPYHEWLVGTRVVAGMTPLGEEYPAEVPAHWRTLIEVDDCAATVARCTDLGGQVVAGPLDVGVGHYAQIIDPRGAALGIVALIPSLRMPF